MKLTKMDHLYQLSFFPTLFPVNCYIVEEEHELTLIDAALPISTKGILNTVERLGKPLTKIVLTHAHDDHVGALDSLKSLLPHVEVMISSRDSHLLANDRSLFPGEANTPIKGGIPKSLKTRADTLLEEGDMVGSLQVIYTPGHTPGSISLLDLRSKALIAGDAFQTRGNIKVAGVVYPFFPFPAWATWDLNTALSSSKKLLHYEPTLLATGHGPLLQHPVEHMKKAIHEAENVLNRMKNRKVS